MRSGFYSLFSERNEQQEREKQIEQQPDRENREVIRADPPTVPPHCPCTQRTQMLNKKKNIQTNKTTPPGAVFATVPASCPTAGSSQPPPPAPLSPAAARRAGRPGVGGAASRDALLILTKFASHAFLMAPAQCPVFCPPADDA